MSLAAAMARLDHPTPDFRPGHVWLAGAGPGDPGCLTLDVLSALTQADAVVYDALVAPRIVAVAEQAELFYAGKRGGQPSMKQDEITALLVRLARQDKRVLRLKGGDPYIFGRGGEEALALAGQNIPFRVLPGLTSSLGALAAAGIPATLRGVNKAIILATGHAADADDDLDWSRLAATGQPIVVYMGMHKLGRIAERLIAGGQARSTPVAVIQSGTTPQERVLVATLDTIAARVEQEGMGAPALIVIGHIVSTRARLVATAGAAS